MQDHRMSHHTGQVLTLAQHDAPVAGPFAGPAADPSIARSWLRCLRQHGLDPADASAPAVLEAARLRERREQLQPMLRIADGEMHSLHRQLAGSGHVVVLTDADGVILDCIADHAERALFRQAGLWSGVDWSEAREGTNGIGTCVVERQALTIYQDEHFRSRHIRLSCSASPVFDPHGSLLAVLDVSSIPRELSRQGQFHTTALVNLSAKAIEGGYFLQHFERDWLLRFHAQPEYVGLFSEGLLAVGSDGRIRAANQSALNLLGRTRPSLLGQPVETVFDLSADALLARHGERRGGVAAAHAPGPPAVRPAARAPPAPGHRCHAGIATRAGRARPVPAGRGPAHRLPPRPARVRTRRTAAAARRDRHRQGSLRPRRAPRQQPSGAAFRRGQLRGDSRDPDRERAVRLPRRQLHRRAPGGHARQAAAGRRRHAVPR